MQESVLLLLDGSFKYNNRYTKDTLSLFLKVPAHNIACMEFIAYNNFANSGDPYGGFKFVENSLPAIDAFNIFSIASAFNSMYLLSKMFGVPLLF